MDYRQADRQIKAFKETRQNWIDILVKYPDRRDAPQFIMSINAKIELLRILREPYPDDYEGDYE